MSQQQMSFDQTGTIIDGAKNNREPHWDAGIEWFELPDDDEIHEYRLVAAPYYYAQHWIQTYKKDKKPGKSFPAICQNFDPVTNTYVDNGCECCLFMKAVNEVLNESEKSKTKLEWKDLPAHITKMGRRMTMASNAIIRDLQIQGAPSNNAANWSFIRPMRFPQGFSKTIKEHQEKFNKRDGKVYALNDRNEGSDLRVSYNSNAEDKNKMYVLAVGKVTPLANEELAQAQFLTNFAQHMKYPKQAEIADALRRFGYYDWINEYRASRPTISVPRSAPAQQAAPSQAPTAFDVPGTPEPPFEPEPAPAPQAVIDSAVAMQQRTFEAPAQPAPAAPRAAPAPVQQAAAPTPQQNGVEGRLQSFSTQTGVPLVVAGKTYAKTLRLYRPDLAVPTCWSTYSATSRANREQCKTCPLRLDCMMATG